MAQPKEVTLIPSMSCRFDTPLILPCGLVLRNRVVRAAAFGGGTVVEQAEVHGEVARGGVAMTIVAYTSVSPDGRTFASQLVLDRGSPPPGLARIAEAAHAGGALCIYQLTHAGSFSDKRFSGGGRALAPSAVFDLATLSYPKECTEADMTRLVEAFASAAALAVADVADGGGAADGVEVHWGHGYLLSQWLSPALNIRTDAHGGTAERRLRFPLRVVRAVRAAVGPKRAVIVKLNVDDGFPGGVTPTDVSEHVRALCSEKGLVDAIVPSAGFVNRNGFYMLRGNVPRAGMVRGLATASVGKAAALAMLGRWLVPELPFKEAFLLDGQRRALATAKDSPYAVPVLAIGGFVSLAGVESALAEGFAGICMARALIREPNLIRNWQRHVNGGISINSNHADPPATADDVTAASSVVASTIPSTDPKRNEKLFQGILSQCSHCNKCVLAALSPGMPSRCVERPPVDIEDSTYDRPGVSESTPAASLRN